MECRIFHVLYTQKCELLTCKVYSSCVTFCHAARLSSLDMFGIGIRSTQATAAPLVNLIPTIP